MRHPQLHSSHSIDLDLHLLGGDLDAGGSGGRRHVVEALRVVVGGGELVGELGGRLVDAGALDVGRAGAPALALLEVLLRDRALVLRAAEDGEADVLRRERVAGVLRRLLELEEVRRASARRGEERSRDA